MTGADDDNDEEEDILSMSSEVIPGSPIYLDTNSDPDEHFATTEEDIMSMNSSEIIIMDSTSGMKSHQEHRLQSINHTTEDFEAMIDDGKEDDDEEDNSSMEAVELMEIETEQQDIMSINSTEIETQQISGPQIKLTATANTAVTTAVTTTAKQPMPSTNATAKGSANTSKFTYVLHYPPSNAASQSSTKPQIVTMDSYGRKAITASILPSAKNTVYTTTTSSATNHNLANLAQYKGMSVPIIKNLSVARPLSTSSGKTATTDAVGKKILATPSTITSLGSVPIQKLNTAMLKNVTFSQVNLQHSSGRQIIRLQPLLASSQQQQAGTASAQRNVLATPITSSTSEPTQITKSRPPTLTYSKLNCSLSSLKVTQDVSLPTKLFQEDESISPDSSIDEENDLMLTEETIYTTEDSNQNNRDISEIGVIIIEIVHVCSFKFSVCVFFFYPGEFTEIDIVANFWSICKSGSYH